MLSQMPRPTPRLFLLSLLLLGMALRLFRLDAQPLWIDEAFSQWISQQPPGDLLAGLALLDQHPPLYYLLLSAWQSLAGSSEFALRLLSVYASVLTLAVVAWGLGTGDWGSGTGDWGSGIGDRGSGTGSDSPRTTHSPNLPISQSPISQSPISQSPISQSPISNIQYLIPLLALLLLTFSPFHIQYAQEARMYALATLLATACIAVVIRGWGSGTGDWGSDSEVGRVAGQQYARLLETNEGGIGDRGLGTGIALQSPNLPISQSPNLQYPIPNTQYLPLLLLLQPLAMLTHHVVALFLPLVLNGAWLVRWWGMGRPWAAASGWLLGQALVLGIWAGVWGGAFVGQAQGVDARFWLGTPGWADLRLALTNLTAASLPPQTPGGWAGILLLAGVALYGLARLRGRPVAFWLLALWLWLPVMGLLLISLRRPLFHQPSLLWILPAYLLLMGVGLAGLGQRVGRWLGGGLLILALLLNGLGLESYWRYQVKEPWDQAAAAVRAEVQAGDLLLFHAAWARIPFDYYFDRLEPPPVVRHSLPGEMMERAALEPLMTPADLPHLRSLLVEHPGPVWLILSHDWYSDPEGLILAGLGEARPLLGEVRLPAIRLLRYGEGGEPP